MNTTRTISLRILCSSTRSRWMSSVSGPEMVVAVPEVTGFIERCMTKVGTRKTHAAELAGVLAAADYRGHFSHGLNRLEMYVKDIESGITLSDGEPVVVKETVATALVDGKNTLGPVVGKLSMETAIQKAQDTGVGWVVANASNHYGICGWYSMMAADKGLLGMSFTNTSPLVVPTRGREALLGTNPITLAAPGKDGDSFVLDMATSAVALGKIEIANVKQETMPQGWGADSSGQVTEKPEEVLDGGGLLPLGGAEVTGGYKGYGLGLMTEIFCGILANAHYLSNIRQWKRTDRVANLGQCFIAVDPNVFAPGFSDRLQDLINICRSQKPMVGETEVLVPGDPERKHMAQVDKQGGINYHPNLIKILNGLADRLDTDRIQTRSS